MSKGKLFQIIGWLSAMVVIVTYGCRQSDEVEDRLNLADSLMESLPDSALIILDGIDNSELIGQKSNARYALLKSMALDKNGVDTTTFEVLQPAIDYYLKNGTADEKLRTYYYKGRIHDNAGEDDLSMETYLTALENCDGITDSLTLARLMVAQGKEFYKEYRIKDFVSNNLQAARIYQRFGKVSQQLHCYKRALSGDVILSDKSEADSVYNLCTILLYDNPSLRSSMLKVFLTYFVESENELPVKDILEEIQEVGVSDDMYLNLAMGYSKIGCPEAAQQYLIMTKIASEDILDSLSFWSVRTEILENIGDNKESLYSLKQYVRLLEEYHLQLFSNELLFSEKKHEMELENMAKIQKRDNVIKWVLAGAAVLLIITLFIYYHYRLNKAARILAEQDMKRLESEEKALRLENENLQLEGDKQRLLAQNLESERVRLQLEAENLHHKIGEMEEEKERLKDLLGSQETLSEEARELIRERISMLNGLIAQALTQQESYGKEFKNYIVKIKKDKKGFQQSLVKVLETTHPEFIAYLKEHGLTERELNYCCLYAIGMRGKEIGTYLDLARHYNISTEVRRKLGLDPNDRNLGPFLRQLMDRGK